jgi:hypothetical protein
MASQSEVPTVGDLTMPRRPVQEFDPAAKWRVVTIDTDVGDRGTATGGGDEASARERFKWLTENCKSSIVILEARVGDDDWVTIERHP